MLNTKFIVNVFIAILTTVSLSVYAAPQDKAEICHNDHIINVSGNSLDAHLAHGDGIVGIDVDANCEPLLPPPPPCRPLQPC
ncbi:MAG: hypothetical protein ACKVHQ_07885 [Gammaproteobacteria bacterium]|jgi:hypothetical protein